MSVKLKLVHDRVSAYKKVGDHLWIHQASGVYYVKKTFKRYRIPALDASTRETSIRLAKAKADQMIADHLAKYRITADAPLERRIGTPVSTVIDEILETVTPTLRARTQENHKLYLGELKTEWGVWDVSRITRASWVEWLKGFRKRKARKTFSDYQKFMNLILRYAHEQKYTAHPLRLPNPDVGAEKPGRVYTPAEIKALWDVLDEDSRDQFVLSFECFMRLREALFLEWSRLDLKTGIVTLRAQDVKTGSKTGRGRAFRLSEKALERMRARYKRIVEPSPYVFPSPENPNRPMNQNKTAWRTAKKRAGIRGKARWHDLRHTALTWALLDSKADPVLVSEYAGVSLRTIQRVYLHSTAEKTRSVAAAVKIEASDQRYEKGLKTKRGK